MGPTPKVRIVQFCFLGLLLYPFLQLFYHLPSFSLPDINELFWVCKNTFWQSIWSSFFTSFFGFFMALGLIELNRNRRIWLRTAFEYGFLLPTIMPPLFTLLVGFHWLDPFPVGSIGVIFIHISIYSGITAILFTNVIEAKLQTLAEISWVMGSSRFLFWRKAFGLVAADFLVVAGLIFTLCWTSFSIPLAVGGGKGTTIEILIYEKMRLSSDWSQALSLSLFQVVILFAFGYWIKPSYARETARQKYIALLGSKFGLGLGVIYVIYFAWGFFEPLFKGWDSIGQIEGLWTAVHTSLVYSAILSGIIGFILIGLLITICFLDRGAFRNFLRGYVPPSTALVGLSLYFFGDDSTLILSLKYIFGFSILSIAGLYRMGLAHSIQGVQVQSQVAYLMGASELLVMRKIIFPQVFPDVLRLSGMGVIWAMGDFALARMIFSQDITFAMVIESLMSSYRLTAASALLGVLLMGSLLYYAIFWGTSYVYRQKYL